MTWTSEAPTIFHLFCNYNENRKISRMQIYFDAAAAAAAAGISFRQKKSSMTLTSTTINLPNSVKFMLCILFGFFRDWIHESTF